MPTFRVARRVERQWLSDRRLCSGRKGISLNCSRTAPYTYTRECRASTRKKSMASIPSARTEPIQVQGRDRRPEIGDCRDETKRPRAYGTRRERETIEWLSRFITLAFFFSF